NTSTLFDRSKIDFDPEQFETKQVFYPSKDGTKIPMFLVYKKGLKLNGLNPTLLYGYGGFNISMTPGFRTSALILLEQGGVFAVANIRGGGEYGENWHLAGTKMNKQNVFDDFIAAAEYLIDEEYTSPEKLGVQGGSNGGLLIGACMNQRPDLFAVALPQVGVLDMLRYHKFTIGRYWSTDYGTSEESQEMFEYLMKYSPLHNIREGVEYPATMIFTADHDDRVVPAHSFKFAAELQQKYDGNTPMLIRIESKAGHGAGTSTQKVIEQYADLWAFFFENTKHKINY
ncbi:MAG: S9 family peptidase, partial [Bacteroidales bacterium]|nr:S9 family peptidase [Bacteroidales bacterium]